MTATTLALAAPWRPAVAPFLVSAIVCTASVPLTMRLAHRLGAVDAPDADRRIHPHPTPRLGGIALFLGFAAALAAFGGSIGNRWQVVAVCGAITVAMVVDDLLELPPWTKLVLEVGAGVLVAVAGITITFFALPGNHPSLIDFGVLAAPITVVWITGMEVSINLLDGADGVAAGVVAIVSGVTLLAAVNRLTPHQGVQDGVLVMSGALMGCCFGFLVWNFAPARVFMGDSGSHFLGVALGIITILGVAKVAVALSLLVPLVALGLPIGDTAYAIVRRSRAGTGIAQPDAGHLHHRLMAMGFSVRETAFTFYLATAILGCIGLALFGHRTVLLVAIVLLTIALVGLFWRNRTRPLEAEEDVEPYLVLPGRPPVPTRPRHGGEAD